MIEISSSLSNCLIETRFLTNQRKYFLRTAFQQDLKAMCVFKNKKKTFPLAGKRILNRRTLFIYFVMILHREEYLGKEP